MILGTVLCGVYTSFPDEGVGAKALRSFTCQIIQSKAICTLDAFMAW